MDTYEFELAAIDSSGLVAEDENGDPLVDTVSVTVYDPARVMVFEAEDATLTGGVEIATADNGNDHYLAGASGDAHTADLTPGTSVQFDVSVDTDASGYYSLYVTYALPTDYGSKTGEINVDGVKLSMELEATGSWEEIRIGTFLFEAGSTPVEVGGGWNYYRIDNIKLLPAAAPETPLQVAATLVNDNPSDEAQALIEFLTTNYATKTLTGQTEYMDYSDPTKTGLREFDKVVAATGGDAPAIVAFDYMDYSSSRVANGATQGTLTEDMIAAHNSKNVILSAFWHWNAPSAVDGDWWSGFYTDHTSFDVAAAMADTNSEEYAELVADMDLIAEELKKFQTAGIPILWRPLHEAQGGWFWWGAKGADAYKALWITMYERYTNHHGLNNLIWIFTHTDSLGEDWYPGDAYVDIVGFDGYDGNNDQNTFMSQFNTLKDRHDGKKLVALTETGAVPDVELMHENNAWWSFFITWNTSGEYGPGNMDEALIAENYGYDGVLNLDDVPGSVEKVGAGVLSDFDRAGEFGAQINWSNTNGLAYSSAWSNNGTKSLGITKDLTAIDSLENMVIQTNPGLEVSDKTSLTLTAYAEGAGDAVNVHMFVKGIMNDASVEQWPEAVALNGDKVELTLDITDYTEISGYGVRFQGLDGTQTEASFYIDSVQLDGETLQEFEGTGNYGGQINWSNAPGLATSSVWTSSGKQSLVMVKDLSTVDGPTDVIIQNYPKDGIDVTDFDSISVDATAINTGTGTNVQLFIKGISGGEAAEEWPAAVTVDGDMTLTIDVSGYETITGYGVRFQGFDAASTEAQFFIDRVRITNSEGDNVIDDFEQVDGWQGQVNWASTDGLTPSEAWGVDGSNSMSLTKDLSSESSPENVVLQTYPELILEDGISTLKLTAYAEGAGADVNVHLFVKGVKDDSAVEQWPDPVLINGTPVELSLDITGYDEITGYGVRFQGLDPAETSASFYVDQVELQAASE